jgi:hypothetical protein
MKLSVALDVGGGDENALLRHFVAAVLNAQSSSVAYRYENVAAIISAVSNALQGNSGSLNGDPYSGVEALKNLLDAANNGVAGCPLGRSDLSGQGSGSGDSLGNRSR